MSLALAGTPTCSACSACTFCFFPELLAAAAEPRRDTALLPEADAFGVSAASLRQRLAARWGACRGVVCCLDFGMSSHYNKCWARQCRRDTQRPYIRRYAVPCHRSCSLTKAPVAYCKSVQIRIRWTQRPFAELARDASSAETSSIYIRSEGRDACAILPDECCFDRNLNGL